METTATVTVDKKLSQSLARLDRWHRKYQRAGLSRRSERLSIHSRTESSTVLACAQLRECATEVEPILRARPNDDEVWFAYRDVAQFWRRGACPFRNFHRVGPPSNWAERAISDGEFALVPLLISEEFKSVVDRSRAYGRKKKKLSRKSALVALQQQSLALELLRAASLNTSGGAASTAEALANIGSLGIHR